MNRTTTHGFLKDFETDITGYDGPEERRMYDHDDEQLYAVLVLFLKTRNFQDSTASVTLCLYMTDPTGRTNSGSIDVAASTWESATVG